MTTKNILVATDFGDASMEALSWAFTFAESMGAKVNVLHVCTEQAAAVRAEALSALQGLAQLHAQSPALGSYTALAGEPAAKVVDFALSSGADLLVVGLNGGMGPKSELLGGRAEGILRNAPCPVVVVRPTALSLLALAEERRRART
jgi:universal stress protein A